ncbi:MAG: TIGR00374 family protein, partial [Bifidobacterium merycicum]|nr:TIGR00374 family protein [Bifidobacterium merycicum]
MHIDDVAPRRTRDFGDLTRAALSLVGAIIVMVFAVYMGGIASGVESDAHTAAQAINWLADIPASVLQQLATVLIVVMVSLQLLFAREWLTTVTAIASMLIGYLASWAVSTLLCGLGDRILALALISATTMLDSGLLPGIYAAMAAFLTTAGPRRIRSSVKWGWNIL